MIYLIASVLCSVVFIQMLKLSQKHGGGGGVAVAVINYAVATVVLAVPLTWRGVGGEWAPLGAGAVNGSLFFVHLLAVLAGYKLAGVSIATALSRAGVVIPSLVAWWFYGDRMTPWRWAGLALAPVVIALLRPRDTSSNGQRPRHLTWRADVTLLLCFLIAGAIGSVHKFAQARWGGGAPAPSPSIQLYQASLFFFAMVFSLVFAIQQNVPFGPRDAVLGGMLGVVNVATLVFVLAGLAAMPATVFFPSLGCLDIALNAIASRILWKERLLRRQIVGLVLAMGIVLLVSL